MIHFSAFGGTETQITPSLRVCITLFGGTELHRPTMARQILTHKRRGGGFRGSGARFRRSHCFCLTLFGSTEVQCPTLAEEFVDFKSLLDSGDVTAEEWDEAMSFLAQEDAGVDFLTFTLFGGFGIEYPDRSDELKRLDKHLELGLISPEEHGSLTRLAKYEAKDARAMLCQMATPQIAEQETLPA